MNLLHQQQLLYLQNPEFQSKYSLQDIQLTFFKCVRWQLEGTMDPIACPYHYFCDSTYPGNYPPFVDVLVLLFTAVSYLATLAILVVDISTKGRAYLSQSKRFLLPYGPVSLPLILLALAKGYRIDALFPLSSIGPAILQLLQVSVLVFDNGADKDIRYVLFEASTASGILHASLYLDSVILPYYTGLDALLLSTFSGECLSCVCRREALVVGGSLVAYRGWSISTFLVVGALCARMVRRLTARYRSKVKLGRILMESLALISVAKDCIYLIRYSPQEQTLIQIACFASILVLILLHLIRKLTTHIVNVKLCT